MSRRLVMRCVMLLAVSGLALTISAAPRTVRPAWAQVQSVPLDVVLAIDQSGSMAESDPANKRIDAARQFVTTAASFQDAYEIRVGGIEFGSTDFADSLRPVIGLSSPARAEVPSAFQPAQRDGTDFRGALCLAWATVTGTAIPATAGCPSLPPAPAAAAPPRREGLRERAVILITDGFPAPKGRDVEFAQGESLAGCPGQSTGNEYFCSLNQTWAALNAVQPVKLYVLGLDQNERWFPTAEPYWKAVTGCANDLSCRRAVRRSANPEALVNDVIEAAVGAIVDLCGQPAADRECRLPAFLTEAQFLVEGLRPNDAVRVLGPDGTERQPGANVERTNEGDRQRWRVRAPARGVWRVQSTNPDARLTVSRLAVPVRFDLKPAPSSPAAGDSLDLEATPAGTTPIDLPSVAGEPLELQVQRGNEPPVTRQVSMEQGPRGLVIRAALPNVTAGAYRATLVLPFEDRRLILGEAQISVAQARPATATPTASPAPTPIPTAAPPPTPAPPCAGGTARLIPGGTEMSAYRFAFQWGWPLRLHKPANVRGEASQCGAGGEPAQLTLSVRPANNTDGGMVRWEAEGVGSVSVAGPLTDEIIDAERVQRSLTLQERGQTVEAAVDELRLTTPWWVSFEQSSGLGYWGYGLPFLAALLLIMYGSTYQTNRAGLRLRDATVYNQEQKQSESVVRGGLLVWRPVELGPGKSRGTLSLMLLCCGPLVLRYPSSASRSGPRKKGKAPSFEERVQAWWRQQRTSWLGDRAAADRLGLRKKQRR